MKRQIHPNLGFCSQCVTCWSIGGDNSPSWKLELRFLKSLSLADQKMETTHQWKLELRFLKSVSHADQRHPGGDTLIKKTPKLRFLKSLLLADQMMETTPPGESLDLGFWDTWSKRWGHPDQKADTPKGGETLIKRWRHPEVEMSKLRFLQSVSLADQMVETTPPGESWNLGFWSHCHLLIKRQRHPDEKVETPKGRDPPVKSWRHPNLGFWSQCHLLIKRWRQPWSKLAAEGSDTQMWSGDTLIKRFLK